MRLTMEQRNDVATALAEILDIWEKSGANDEESVRQRRNVRGFLRQLDEEVGEG